MSAENVTKKNEYDTENKRRHEMSDLTVEIEERVCFPSLALRHTLYMKRGAACPGRGLICRSYRLRVTVVFLRSGEAAATDSRPRAKLPIKRLLGDRSDLRSEAAGGGGETGGVGTI